MDTHTLKKVITMQKGLYINRVSDTIFQYLGFIDVLNRRFPGQKNDKMLWYNFSY